MNENRTVTLNTTQADRVLALAQYGFKSIGYTAESVGREEDLAALRAFGVAISWTPTAQKAQDDLDNQLALF